MVPGMTEAAKEHDCCVVIFATTENKKDTTVWLELAWPEGKRPDDMLADLEKVDWKDNSMLLQPLIFPDGVECKSITAKGSGLFGSFQGNEKANAMRRVRSVLKKYGYTGVGTQVLTAMDMM